MKTFLLSLFLIVLPLTVGASEVITCSFLSPLDYTSGQWHVRAATGPVYLARLERNRWRVLACFDGTNGKYFLNWSTPAAGIYVVLDSFGTCSEQVVIR